MSDSADDTVGLLQARIEELEIRAAHQELTLDELTRQQLELERLLREQGERLQRLEAQLRAAAPALVARLDEETPPPHY